MKRSLLLALPIVLPIFYCQGQGEIPVDMHTGTPVINIPLWTINDHDLSQTVGIYYNAAGLKLEQTPEYVGLGWGLSGGGRITREVRGLPDDFDGIPEAYAQGQNHDDRRGWLRPIAGTSTVPAKSVGDFLPSSDLSALTCTDESADFIKLADYRYYVDTEPDIFHYSCGGISGSFVFDNSTTPQIRLIPYQDVNIAYTVNQVTKDIIAFAITTNNGTVYHFERPVVAKQSCKYLGEGERQFFHGFSVLNSYTVFEELILDDYEGHPAYNSDWMLTRISSVSGAEITYHYSEYDFEVLDTLKIGVIQPPASVPVHEIYQKLEEQRLNLITSSTGEQVKFLYEDSLLHTIQILFYIG